MLITVGRDANDQISIPTVHQPNTSVLKDHPQKAAGLCQKVVIISDRSSMVWSGMLIQAITYTKFLRQHCSSPGLSVDTLRQILNGYPAADVSEIQFRILFAAENGFFTFHNSVLFDLSGLMSIFVAGTGTEHFIQNLEQLGTKPLFESGATSLTTALTRAVAFTGGAFASQIFAGYGLRNAWGGGFEIAYYDGTRFTKVDRLLYLAWVLVERTPKLYDAFLQKPFFYQYYLSGQARIVFYSEGPETPNREYLVDAPFDRDSPVNLVDSSVEATTVVNCIRRVDLDGLIEHGAFVSFNSNEQLVRVEKTPSNQIQIAVKNDYALSALAAMLSNGAGLGHVHVWGRRVA